LIARAGDRLQVSGRLTKDEVSALVGADLQAQDTLVVDLAAVEAVDSAAVSLLLSWLRRAQRNQVTLCFVNVPENLASLIGLYGVAELLPLCRAAQS
jgi:phospholipid transport system transporter-binding protein